MTTSVIVLSYRPATGWLPAGLGDRKPTRSSWWTTGPGPPSIRHRPPSRRHGGHSATNLDSPGGQPGARRPREHLACSMTTPRRSPVLSAATAVLEDRRWLRSRPRFAGRMVRRSCSTMPSGSLRRHRPWAASALGDHRRVDVLAGVVGAASTSWNRRRTQRRPDERALERRRRPFYVPLGDRSDEVSQRRPAPPAHLPADQQRRVGAARRRLHRDYGLETPTTPIRQPGNGSRRVGGTGHQGSTFARLGDWPSRSSPTTRTATGAGEPGGRPPDVLRPFFGGGAPRSATARVTDPGSICWRT